MQNGSSGQTGHTPEVVLAAYVAGRCTPTERTEVEEHCLDCEGCRARLAVVLRACFGEKAEEERELEPLFSLGLEAADLARRQFSDAGAKPSPEEKTPARKPQPSNPWWRSPADLVLGRRGCKSYLTQAAALALLLTIGVVGYLAFKTHAPVDNSLAALRLAHRENRPLEVRVTGGFDYQPYERKRGVTKESGVDRDQLNYALAELTRAASSHPTPEAQHAFGRLYLLLGDFDRAEEKLTQALAGAPREAKIHADLAALYYERSKHADPQPLLTKAVEHYDTTIGLEPELKEAWFNRALCHEQMGQLGKARADWERYLELDPGSAWAGEAREHLKKLQAQATR